MANRKPTDTEMLDWLSKQDCVSFEEHYNPMVDEWTAKEKRTEGLNGHIDFFSTASQHLSNVPTLREAIARAMRRDKADRG